jgi:hypothetical protein
MTDRIPPNYAFVSPAAYNDLVMEAILELLLYARHRLLWNDSPDEYLDLSRAIQRDAGMTDAMYDALIEASLI